MFTERIFFEEVERIVSKSHEVKTFFGSPEEILHNYTRHLSFVTDDQDWFDSLKEGQFYSIAFGGSADEWKLDRKKIKSLELEFSLAVRDK